jgi:hypothetical protein
MLRESLGVLMENVEKNGHDVFKVLSAVFKDW